MQVIAPRPMQLGLNSPLELPNLAAWRDLSRPASTASDYVRIDGSNRISLVADTSGNSAVNGLVMAGGTGNYASRPNAAAINLLGDLDLRVRAQVVDWASLGATRCLIGREAAGPSRSFLFELTSAGKLFYASSANGSTFAQSFTSTNALGFSADAIRWVRVTHDMDDGAGGNVITFYTSTDGVTWSVFDTQTNVGVATRFNNSTEISVGAIRAGATDPFSGVIYRAQMYDGIAGTLAFDANFTTVAKLAASFTESSSNAATVTINTSGATGARISGARDWYQGTAANQPVYSIGADGFPLATLDGSNDYWKSAPYSAVQPLTRYTLFKHKTWTSGDILWDGNTAGAAKISQTGSTPNLQLNAGSAGPQLATFVLDTWAVCVEVINGVSSSMRRNAEAANAAAAGAGNPNGSTMGADGGGSNPSDMTFRERIEFSAAHDAATAARVVDFMFRKWAVTA